MQIRIVAIACALGLGLGCDGKSDDKAPAKAAADEAPKKAAKAPPGKAAPGKAGGPHAGMAPHGGKAPAAQPKREKQPPRDVTPTGKTREEKVKTLVAAVPEEWETHSLQHPMRVVEFYLPGPGGEAELIVYYFQGGAGGKDANINRWKGQFTPPEGKTIDDITKTTEIKSGDLTTTLVDITGTYVAAVRPGADQKHNDADQRMLVAIVEGSGDPYYFKCVGPTKTVDLWADAYKTMLEGIKKG